MASTTTGFAVQGFSGAHVAAVSRTKCHRQISPRAGRALEILGHAIEYLTDEYVQDSQRISADDPQVKAIQLLMGLNREIYFECPVVPSFGERFRAFFGTAAR